MNIFNFTDVEDNDKEYKYKIGLPFEIDYTELPYYKSDKKRGK